MDSGVNAAVSEIWEPTKAGWHEEVSTVMPLCRSVVCPAGKRPK